MADRAGRQSTASDGRGGITASGEEFVQLVVDYAKQETIGPLQGLGRFVAMGTVAAVATSLGTLLLLVALLRLLQTETGTTFAGNLSWLPYLITAVAAVVVAGLAAWRVTRGPARRVGPADSSHQGRAR